MGAKVSASVSIMASLAPIICSRFAQQRYQISLLGSFVNLPVTEVLTSDHRTQRKRRTTAIAAHWQNCRVSLADVEKLLGELEGVRRTERHGQWPEWRYHGRLVARQLDADHLVIRIDFDFRRSLMQSDTAAFSVPNRYVKHMMVVADFVLGDPDAIEDALENAWQLQRSAD